MIPLNIVNGNAINPISDGNKIICHVCNDIGKWGKGFVLALSSKWKEPEIEYRKWYNSRYNSRYNSKYDFYLGEIQLVKVEYDIYIGNMIAQHGIRSSYNKVPLCYDSLSKCLEKLSILALYHNASIHMPMIGCGLAGGKWEIVENIIIERLCSKDINVTVYKYE